MKPLYIIAAALAATSMWVVAAESVEKLPEPWGLFGKSPASYEAGIDHSVTVSGKGAKFIRYSKGDEKTWATVMQVISAEHYRGQRVRFQAKVKTRDVSDWAGLWMRVDGPKKEDSMLYNSADKPIKGSTDWQIRSVVLDVPADAKAIAFGVIDAGTGQVWIDALSLEPVATSVPADQPIGNKMATTPTL